MVFSSAVFLFAFLPIVFILHTAIRNTTVRNILLIVASLLFYAWGEPAYILLLLLSILVNFVLGRFVWGRKPVLAAGVVINLAFLIVFKYAGFIVQSLNAIPFINIREPGISMPIGISFYTFQAMSYVIDTYRDDEKRPGSFFDVMLYICLFPQLVAGPIVKYNSVREQLRDRQVGAEEISAGIRRFIIGLSKKMLIANVMAAAVDKMFALDMAQLDTASAWVGAVCYLFQIYFDFSGYSDMAVGMGKMFGFTFPENFDYPYTASSVRQFWMRMGEQRRKTALICTGKTESWTVGRRMICRNMFRRFQRRMKRCLDSMEMNSGSSRGKRNLREESLQEMPDFWRIWRRKTEKSSHRSGNYRMEAECGSQSQLMEIRKD